MRRPLTLLLFAVVAALLLVGCGGESTAADTEPPPPPPTSAPPPAPPSKPSPTFTKADLPRIALGPKNAPPGLVFVKDESGPKKIEFELAPSQVRPLRALGFVAMHDAIFAARAPGSDQRISQRIWLFRNRGGATEWLKQTRDDTAALQWSPLTAPLLGDGSWAAQGLIQVAGGQGITHAFRLGNTVHTVLMYGDRTPPSEAGSLAAAKAALAKAKKG
jgi:hypothetical protein